MEHQIIIDRDKCVGCGACEKDCVAHNIQIRDKKAQIIANDCIMCGHCVAICPQEAVSITGYADQPVICKKNTRLNPEDVLNTIRFRRSIRQFKEKDIPQNVVEQILEAGRLTHTAKNMQDISFIIVDDIKDEVQAEAVKLFGIAQKLGGIFSPLIRRNKIGKDFFFFHAPLVIVITAKNEIDAALAAQNMEFIAEANGLGTLFSGYFTMAAQVSHKIKNMLGLKKGEKVKVTLVMGYPATGYFRSAPREKANVRYR